MITRNSPWRLIPLLNASGKMQMAIDSWLLEKHRLEEHPPTIRFYTWSRATISLGYHQKNYPDFWQQIIWQNQPLDIVRRPTGGRSVLHQGDLTYTIVASATAGKRLAVYKDICEFLIRGWRSLDVELNYGNADREYVSNHNCFATATVADLVTSTGKKAIGSSQLRRGKAILQHGSMMLAGNPELFVKIFNELPPANLKELIRDPGNYAIANIVETLTVAARDWFEVDIIEQPLSNKEWQDILTR